MLITLSVRSFFSLIFLTNATLALADQHEIRWFDVEVVIFENVETPESSNTYWNPQAYKPLLENSISLTAEDNLTQQRQPVEPNAIGDDADELAAISIAPRLLAPETHRLTIEAAAIKKSSRYTLLVHQAWRQAGTAREQAIPIQFRSGEPIPAFERIANPQGEIYPIANNGELPIVYEEPQLDTLETPPAAPLPVESIDNFQPVFAHPPYEDFGAYTQTRVYPLDGTITVALSRFLHIYTDLALTKTGLSSSGYNLQSFILKSHRRMRSRVLHYIDHPKIGMLVLITPFEQDENS